VFENFEQCSATGEGEEPPEPEPEPEPKKQPEPEPCCFAAGAPVHTDHGEIPIEKIKIGDEVLSRNSATGKDEYEPVEALTPIHKNMLLDLGIEGEREPLRPSVDHPFWTRRGDAADGQWIEARNLKLGDLLEIPDGNWRRITAITPVANEQTVYNFTVAKDHDYFVGETGFLVHNENCPCANGPLDWSKTRNDGFTTPEHVAQHAFDDLNKPFQGVFADDPISTVEQAWQIAIDNGISPTVGGNGNWNYVIPYPESGLQGGYKGAADILNKVRIVTEPGCNKVVTAFPE
jgi:hypothetical protein